MGTAQPGYLRAALKQQLLRTDGHFTLGCLPEHRSDLVPHACLTFKLALTGFQQGRLHTANTAPGRRLQSSENHQLTLPSSRGEDGDEYLFTLTAFIRGGKRSSL